MMKKIVLWLQGAFCGDRDEQIILLNKQIKELKESFAEKNNAFETLKKASEQQAIQYSELSADYDEAVEKIVDLSGLNNEIDKFCEKNYRVIDNIAYTQKRKTSNNNSYNIFLQELITPDAWEVKNFFRRLSLNGNKRQDISKIGNKTAKYITWTSDKNLDKSGDYYLYPQETIADKKGDCEDHTFINMSAHKEIGGAWGFLTQGENKIGHSFNVFVDEGVLYVLETTGNKAKIVPYEGSNYEIYFIITRNKTYRLKSGVIFGELAGWD